MLPSPAVSIGLAAKAAVVVEIVAPEGRVFRLSSQVGEGGIDLRMPLPFEQGRHVRVRFRLPGDTTLQEVDAQIEVLGLPVEEEGERGGCGLRFLGAPVHVQTDVMNYVVARLKLPPLDLSRFGPQVAE